MSDSPCKPRWYRLTPDRLIIGLLIAECLLWLSQRLHMPTWHKGYAVLVAVAAVGAGFLFMLLWLIASLLFRRRFQFSIRSLLVLTVVVAIPCSWLAVEMKKARDQHEAVEKWQNEFLTLYNCQLDETERSLPGAAQAAPAWLRRLTGDDFFADAIPMKRGSWCEPNRLLIDGWTREQVQAWFGSPTEIKRSQFTHPVVDSPALPEMDEQWCYRHAVDDVPFLFCFKLGIVVMALDDDW